MVIGIRKMVASGGRVGWKGREGAFWGDENVVYLDWGGDNMVVYICPNFSNLVYMICTFYCV